MTRLVGFLLFLVFIDESAARYGEFLPTPMAWVGRTLLDGSILKVRPFDLIMLVVLLIASGKPSRKYPPVAPMRSTLFLSLATTIVWFAYGMARGGDFKSASWQVYLILSTILLAFAIAAAFRTAEDFCGLAKWIIAAAGYHAVMCWISYFTWGRHRVGESGAFLTMHDDTIQWVVSVMILVVNAIEKRSVAIKLRNLAGILLFLGAIQFNSRRLAWVSLALGFVVMYALFPQTGAVRRTVRRVTLFAVPLVALYVIVGWGRQNAIFLPLRSFSTVSTHEDGSTLARNAENLGLIATANYTSTVLGSGWGHKYAALTTKYDISEAFDLWPYVPHNSILGLLAFTGILGFAGFWLAIPTAVFLNARVARLAASSSARTAGLIGAAQLVVSANQLYGDMGIRSAQTMYVIAVSYAMAMRLPPVAGVWGARPRNEPRKH